MLQVTCFLKASHLAEPTTAAQLCSKVVRVSFFAFQKQEEIRQPTAVDNPRAVRCSLSSWAATTGPSPFTSLRTKQHVVPGLCRFLQCFQASSRFTPPMWYVNVVISHCYFALTSTGCDHDAAPKASLQKADRAFLQVISSFTFPLKSPQASYVEIILHKSKC